MSANPLVIEEHVVFGRNSLLLKQGGLHAVFWRLISKKEHGDLKIFLCQHHAVLVKGDQFMVYPYGPPKNYFVGDTPENLFSCNIGFSTTYSMRSLFGIWLQMDGYWMCGVSEEEGEEPTYLPNMSDPQLKNGSQWWDELKREYGALIRH